MSNTTLWGMALGGLLLPGSAAGQEASAPLTWALVGATPGRQAIVVAPVSELRADAVPSVSQDPNGTFRVTLTAPAKVSTPPGDDPPINSGDVPANPTYVITLPAKLAGQRIAGEDRTTTLFDSYSWNLWHAGSASIYEQDQPRKPPRTIGLNVADAKSIVVTGLGVPAKHVKIHGPHDGVVVKQTPGNAGTITPRSTRVTFVTRRAT